MAITELSQLDLSQCYTYADYLSWRLQERVELIRGRIVKMSPAPGRRHQKIATNLTYLLVGARKAEGGPCEVYTAPFDVRLPAPKGEKDHTVVQPDLCVVCDLEKLDDKGCRGAPDLVVEILSPGNAEREMRDKFEVYETAGVREYWVVDPEHEVVSVYKLNEEHRFVGLPPRVKGDVLRSTIFPAMELDLGEVFGE